MSSFESISNTPEDKKDLSNPSVLKKMAMAAVVAGPLIAGTEVASAIEAPTTPSPKMERTIGNGDQQLREEEIERKLDDAKKFLLSKVESIGLLSAPGFIKEIRQQSPIIRTFLKNPETVPPCEGVLGEILKVYSEPLKAARYHSPELYLRTAAQFHQALLVVETESLPDIKEKLQKIFRT